MGRGWQGKYTPQWGVPKPQPKLPELGVLGANVRRARVAGGMTQERLAELVGVNPRTVQKIEAGKINILVTTVLRLQQALGCSWEDLMKGAAAAMRRGN